MVPLPHELLEAIPESGRTAAETWWRALSTVQREQITGLWDQRVEVCFFDRQTDASGTPDDWSQVPIVEGGRFLPHDSDGREEWEPDYFEHLLQHPELMIAYQPAERVFHIGCTAHAAARHCLADQGVPANFACPVAERMCPLEQLRGAVITRRTSRFDRAH